VRGVTQPVRRQFQHPQRLFQRDLLAAGQSAHQPGRHPRHAHTTPSSAPLPIPTPARPPPPCNAQLPAGSAAGNTHTPAPASSPALGYTAFSLGGGFSAFAKVNNLFDRQYFSAGRLGINPFSPSVEGDIGPSGWNYDSDDRMRTTLVAQGAPRAYWVGIEYRFD
jgi:hypothetical protein